MADEVMGFVLDLIDSGLRNLTSFFTATPSTLVRLSFLAAVASLSVLVLGERSYAYWDGVTEAAALAVAADGSVASPFDHLLSMLHGVSLNLPAGAALVVMAGYYGGRLVIGAAQFLMGVALLSCLLLAVGSVYLAGLRRGGESPLPEEPDGYVAGIRTPDPLLDGRGGLDAPVVGVSPRPDSD